MKSTLPKTALRHRNVQLAGDGIRVDAGDVLARIGVFPARAVIGQVEVEEVGRVFCHHVPAPDFGVRNVIRHGGRGGKIDGGGDIVDAPRDKCAHFREINGTAAAFQYLQKNYNPTASSFLRPSTGKYR